MDISARASSLADRPRLGHLGHQCSHAPGVAVFGDLRQAAVMPSPSATNKANLIEMRFISRADVADFLVKQIDDDAFLYKTPLLTS